MNNYASVDDLKATSNIAEKNMDGRIQQALDAAAAVIDRFCGRPDGFVAPQIAVAREFGGNDCDYLYFDSECVAVSQVEIRAGAGGTWTILAASAWQAFAGDYMRPGFRTPYDGVLLTSTVQNVFTSYRVPTVRITARWGYADTCPPPVAEATIAQATRWFKRGQSAYADATAGENTGGVLLYRKALDPDIQMMLVNAKLKRSNF